MFLYQLDMQEGENMDQMGRFLAEYDAEQEVRERAEKWIRGIWERREKLDELIGRVSENWDLNRITRVDRSNLRLAVYQFLACPEIPAKVVINEAVELAKLFSTAQAPAFVNGVLDAIRKNISSEPMQPRRGTD
ncbi:MAG: hypothetical protein AMJ79_11640 [Phycisphaerae bacterium SM23_30]|nr:MAG: hypothetical protein AMJ79_11640 [Phycisphaerae bacterium SM23_30]